MLALFQARLVLRCAAFLVVGLGTLWYVTAQTGPQDGEVVVFVQVDDVDLVIGPREKHVDRIPPGPLVLSLPMGEHRFIVKRRGELLLEREFHVPAGGSHVLTAYDGRPDVPKPPDPVPVPAKKSRRT